MKNKNPQGKPICPKCEEDLESLEIFYEIDGLVYSCRSCGKVLCIKEPQAIKILKGEAEMI